jgi:hypothetical protein
MNTQLPSAALASPAVAPGLNMSGMPVTSNEPLYVNAKQYNRIVKRREARARQQALSRTRRKENAKSVDLNSMIDSSILKKNL